MTRPEPATILIAEDDSSQRALLRHLLTHAGHDVVDARDGAEALALVCDLDPDLIITDYDMPVMDGLALVRSVRAAPERAGLPILMLTARSSDGERLSGLEAGVDDYLAKPFSRAEVAARVRNLLRLRGALRRVEEQNEALRGAMHAVQESQRRAIAAEKLACIGKLAMGLCHELNNPLAVVRANLDVLEDYVEELVAGAPAVEIAAIRADLPVMREENRAACGRLRALTEQFVELQPIDQGPPPKTIALDSAMRAAVAGASKRGRSEIRFAPPAEPILASGPAHELSRSLTIILGRFAELTRSAVTARLEPGPAPQGRAATLTLAGEGAARAPIDVSRFFDPEHVASDGRVAYDFALMFARDVLFNMGAHIDIACVQERLTATISFPTA